MSEPTPTTESPIDGEISTLGRCPEHFNIAELFLQRVRERPDSIAVREPSRGRWVDTTFAELDRKSDAIAAGLVGEGLEPGDRVSLFLHPGADLIATVYAIFKLGAVAVLIDPGMGRQSLLDCIQRIRPRALVGVPKAHVARTLFPKFFESVEIFVTAGRRLGWSGARLASFLEAGSGFEATDTHRDDEAAILFTSGSTGPPKGVVYTHAMFRAQAIALSRVYHFKPGEVDVACFPLFALIDTALGMTSVFPEMDPSRPGQCSPQQICRALEENRATTTFGSPAIWRRVVPYCLQNIRRFPDLRRVLIAGAPVPPSLVEDLHKVLGLEADVYTPYGATEALPVASLQGRELVGPLRKRTETGSGTCVGYPTPGTEVRVIRIVDEVIETWSDDLCLEAGETGEICVRGPAVTKQYKFDEAATARAKIHDPATGDTWHRMGDGGYFDAEGKLWFCGRVAHRVETAHGTLLPVPIENIYNTQARVFRSAVVGVGPRGEQEPVLIIEPPEGGFPRSPRQKKQMAGDILRIGGPHAEFADIKRVLFHRHFPVDPRHNAKIHREELARWAATELE